MVPVSQNNNRSIIGEYSLKKCIGEGSFGKVYIAENATGSKVAVKYSKNIQMAQNESTILRALSNSVYFAKWKTSYRHNGEFVIVLELALCDVETILHENEGHKMAMSTIQKLLFQVTLGLEALHSFGVIHRDVKCGNILISYPTQTKTIRFLVNDFGMSYQYKDSNGKLTPEEKVPDWMGKRAHDTCNAIEHKRHMPIDDLLQLTYMSFFCSNSGVPRFFASAKDTFQFKKNLTRDPGLTLPIPMFWLTDIFRVIGEQADFEVVDYEKIKDAVKRADPSVDVMEEVEVEGGPDNYSIY